MTAHLTLPPLPLAHGLGDGVSLPLPFPLMLLAAAASLVGLAGWLTSRATTRPAPVTVPAPAPLPAPAAGGGARPAPAGPPAPPAAVAPTAPLLHRPAAGTRTVLALVGLVLTAGLLALALLGPDDAARNAAPRLAFGLLWPALVPLAALLGGFARHLSPLRTLGSGLLRLVDPDGSGVEPVPEAWGVWPAALGLALLAGLELVAPAEPALLALALSAYLLAHLAAILRYGPQWLAQGEALEVTAELVGRLSPLRRDANGRLRVTSPRAALQAPLPPGSLAVLAVLIGAHLFDFVADTGRWAAVESMRQGAELYAVRGAGLAACIGLVAVAGRVAGHGGVLLPALIPLVLGYGLAHHTPVLLVEGQAGLRQLLNPGIRAVADYELLPVAPVAVFILLAFLAAHLLAVRIGHDLSFARYDPRGARAVQFPLRALLLVSLVGGMALRFPA